MELKHGRVAMLGVLGIWLQVCVDRGEEGRKEGRGCVVRWCVEELGSNYLSNSHTYALTRSLSQAAIDPNNPFIPDPVFNNPHPIGALVQVRFWG